MPSEDIVLKIVDLCLTRDEREILRGVTLSLERGKVHALLGLNGSGKSTLAYTLMGSAGYKPDSGEVWLDGEEITSLDIAERGKRGLTLAWQEPARFEGLTVSRYIGLGMSRPDIGRVREALDAVALNPALYLTRFVDDSLSGGERKRVELAAIYAMRPKVAILDEPDSGIDAMTLSDIGRLIHRLAEEGTTVLLISHRNEVVEIADLASLVCEGRVMATGDPTIVCDTYSRWCRPCELPQAVESEADYERL
ncbi:MAG: ABC transporter ATP-binding protein [Anaerolineae bacterium]|jgi:Fe-S cluster assembly ATP-binding protein|nr:ABC transporter ATP-binding protein [Anaerolineae bacterium]